MKSNSGLYNEFISRLDTTNVEELSYSTIDELVARYQSGDSNAAEELIQQLAPYMIKFFKIIRLGILDLSDKDSRKFISLFIDRCDIRIKLKKVYQSTEVRNEAYQAGLMIQSLCSSISSEDIVQELIVILLTLAKRYEKRRRKVNFCGYLYNSFRFELSRRLKEMIQDPIMFNFSNNASYYDGEYDNDNEILEDNPLVYVNEPLIMLEEELGNSWIRGLTCSGKFSQLTQMQRIILKMYYVDGEGDTAIAERLGVHRNTVRNQRNKAKELLAEGDSNGEEDESD